MGAFEPAGLRTNLWPQKIGKPHPRSATASTTRRENQGRGARRQDVLLPRRPRGARHSTRRPLHGRPPSIPTRHPRPQPYREPWQCRHHGRDGAAPPLCASNDTPLRATPPNVTAVRATKVGTAAFASWVLPRSAFSAVERRPSSCAPGAALLREGVTCQGRGGVAKRDASSGGGVAKCSIFVPCLLARNSARPGGKR